MEYNVGTGRQIVSDPIIPADGACTVVHRFVHCLFRDRMSRTQVLVRNMLIPALLFATAGAMSREEATVDQLKARVSSASVPDKVHICVQIAEKQLTDAQKLYESGDYDKAQPLLTDVVAFSELARDYSIQSNKHQKQTEISIRAMSRKLTNILHVLGHDDQPPVQDAIHRLERARDDLLTSMFPKGAK